MESQSYFSVAERPAQIGDVAGGYALIPVWQLCRLWDCYQQGSIRFADLRLWLAAREAQERRCCLDSDREPYYSVRELDRLTGCSARVTIASLKRLTKAGIDFSFSPTALNLGSRKFDESNFSPGLQDMLDAVENHRRALPMPRRTLRMLAQCGKPAVVATVLGHLFRCVYYRSGQIASYGRVKGSFIAEVFNINERSVKSARSHLIDIGWLIPLTGAGGHAAKRWGGQYQVALDFARPESYAKPSVSAEHCTGFSPHSPGICTGFSPCSKQVPFPTERFNNQKLGSTEPDGAKAQEGKSGKRAVGKGKSTALGEPTLRHIVREDLTDTARTLELFEQAGEAGLINRSEHGRLVFVSLAEHALVHGTRNAPGLLNRLLRENKFNYITQDDEDAARQRINRELYQVKRERAVEKPKPFVRPKLTDDQKFVQACILVAQKRRVEDPYFIARQVKPWTREQWDSAQADYEDEHGRAASAVATRTESA